MDLSEAALEEAIIRVREFASSQDWQLTLRPTRLYVHKDCVGAALRIMGFKRPPFARGQGPRARRLALKHRRCIKVEYI